MVRNISKRNLAISGILTLCVFIIGILVGVTVSEKRLAYGESQIREQRVELDSMQMQYTMIDQANIENSCAALSVAIDENVKKLLETGSKIEQYSTDINFDEQEYSTLKREYTISEIRYWLFAQKAKEACMKDVASIIYFYSDDEACSDCSTQSRVLTYLKGQLNDRLLIFSIDASFQAEPLVGILRNSYNITQFPSLLVNDRLYSGFVSEEKLKEYLCAEYENKEGIC